MYCQVMDTFTSLIGQWPTKSVLANDCRVDYGVVHQWGLRDSIPADYWPDVVTSARKNKIEGVSLKSLNELKRKKRVLIINP